MFKFGLTAFALWAAIIIGWGINIVKAITGILALAHLSDIGGELVLRAVGIIFFPLGAIMGLFVW